jgi:conjugative transfer signal peptidase TraF
LAAARRWLRSASPPPLLAGAAAIALLAAGAAVPPRPRLIWNASESAPTGLYMVVPGEAPWPGVLVVAWLPREARALAARRHYLPANVPILKRVAAGPGDHICAAGEIIVVNYLPRARRARRDPSGRPLPAWHGCRTLARGETFLLMPAAGSFDGRYFGVTPGDLVIGRAIPLWVR